MVLQRWQTVYLLIATILMAAFAFMTSISIQAGPQEYILGALVSGAKGCDTHPDLLLMVMDDQIIVVSILTIIRYKNLKE